MGTPCRGSRPVGHLGKCTCSSPSPGAPNVLENLSLTDLLFCNSVASKLLCLKIPTYSYLFNFMETRTSSPATERTHLPAHLHPVRVPCALPGCSTQSSSGTTATQGKLVFTEGLQPGGAGVGLETHTVESSGGSRPSRLLLRGARRPLSSHPACEPAAPVTQPCRCGAQGA